MSINCVDLVNGRSGSSQEGKPKHAVMDQATYEGY